MAILDELKKLKIERKGTIEAAQAVVVKAKEDKRSLTAEDRASLDKMLADAKSKADDIERLTSLYEMERAPADTRMAGIADTATDPKANSEEARMALLRKGFSQWIRRGNASLDPEIRTEVAAEFARIGTEDRALSSLAGVQGGYTVAPGLVPKLEVALKYYGGIPEVATFWNTAQGGPIGWPSMNDTINTGRFQGENTPARDTAAALPAFGLLNFNAYMFDSDIILLPVQLMEDSAIDIEQEIAEAAGIRIGRILNTMCTTGNGNSQPLGIIPATAPSQVTSAAATAIAYTDIQRLRFGVNKAYRSAGSQFMMHDAVYQQLTLLLDSNNRPLFLAGGIFGDISKKNPDRFAGHEIVINNDMASTLASGAVSVLFGALNKYRVRRVGSMVFIRFTERYMNSLQVGFMAYQRFDGNLVDAGTHPVAQLVQA
ncbi:MAG: phage major capsid protein [Phycisphaerae bacterium]